MSLVKTIYGDFIGGRGAVGLLIIRVAAGVAFVLHGWTKIKDPFNWMGEEAGVPGFFQLLAAVSEFGGGIAWTLGLLTPLFSLGVLCTMATATYMHAVIKGDPFVGQGSSYEQALTYLCIALLLLLIGPGKLSLDYLLFGRRRTAQVE